jgi:hypothetical protein
MKNGHNFYIVKFIVAMIQSPKKNKNKFLDSELSETEENKIIDLEYEHPKNCDELFFEDINEVKQDQSLQDNPKEKQLVNLIYKLKKELNCDDIFKLRMLLASCLPQELKSFQKKLILFLPELHKQVVSNMNIPVMYNVYKSYSDLIIDVLKDDNLLKLVPIKKSILENVVADLDNSMKTIIANQEQMKKRRKNIKERERLQRKLNEAREKVKALGMESPDKQE